MKKICVIQMTSYCFFGKAAFPHILFKKRKILRVLASDFVALVFVFLVIHGLPHSCDIVSRGHYYYTVTISNVQI